MNVKENVRRMVLLQAHLMFTGKRLLWTLGI